MNSNPLFLGVSGDEAFFDVAGNGVLLDTRTHATRIVDLENTQDERLWLAASASAPRDTWSEIACYAFDPEPVGDVEIVAAASNRTRAHTIPKAVAKEAQLGIARAERLGRQTAMSLFTGHLLATGGQVSYAKLQHVARFFNTSALAERGYRNALQKTTWSLWGGDAARRWVNAMVAKKTLALISDGYLIHSDDLETFDREDVILFALTQEGDPFAVEGLFYVNDANDTVNVWDAGHWTPYGDIGQLDAWADRLVEIDEETAMNVAASFDEQPGELVHLSTLNPHETALAIMASFAPDLLQARVAAAEYTPQERSQNAGEQPRDAAGRFATVGAKGTMKSGTRGTIRGINPANKYLLVEAENGNVFSIPSRDFTIQDDNTPGPVPPQPNSGVGNYVKVPDIDLSGILAQPRAVANTTKAVLARSLPTLGPAELRQIIDNYEEFIRKERDKNASKFATDGLDLNGQTSTPDTSDIKPIYMAVVDRDDPKAVLDLIALSPASSATSAATTFRRVNGQWVQDPKVLQDLKSPTPPPVVVLYDDDFKSVLQQVDRSSPAMSAAGAQIFIGANNEVWEFLLAAGNNQTGVGAAERLRIYWTSGKGGLKIRWGTGGDWKRCNRYLRKYLGERAKGYCAIRHHEVNGFWPGDRRNR